MKKHQIDILLKVLKVITALTTIIGAVLEITHPQVGSLIFLIGFVSVAFVTVLLEMRKKASDYKSEK